MLRAYFVIFLQYRIVREDSPLQPFLKYRKDLSLNEKQNNIYHYTVEDSKWTTGQKEENGLAGNTTELLYS